jgi:DNA polymerase I
MEMSMRGLRIDQKAKRETVAKLNKDLALLESRFAKLSAVVVGGPVNWRSPLQVKNLFYTSLHIKEIKKRNTQGIYTATVNEDALNKLLDHFWAAPLARLILAMRTIGKKLGFLETQADPDGRLRTSFNITGTNTGRLSSAMSDFGTGTNLQNVDTALRYPIIADPGMILVNVDLEQADGRNVAAIIHEIFYDSHGPDAAAKYLDACESGDLHTTVCRMAWNDLPWPEDRKGWRAVADLLAYRDLSYRDMAKKLGHGTNYYGTPRTMAMHTHLETRIIESFQGRYFGAFPLIKEWHNWTINEIKTTGVLTTLYGRRRHFFGRGDDQSTWRKAIAYCPQSMTGHQIDMGLLNLWRHMPEAQLLLQVHDSILFQVPFRRLSELLPRAMELLRYPRLLRGGREFFVPLEAQVGWNWGKVEMDKKGAVIGNPFGLMKWKGEEKRLPPPSLRLEDYLHGRLA